MQEYGPLIERLSAEPSVSEERNPSELSRDRAVDHLAEIVVKQFDLTTLEDPTVIMIIGSVEHLKDHYALRQPPLPRACCSA
jgi:hypothetical protein